MRHVAVSALGALLLASAGFAEMVDAGGYRIDMVKQGTGSPAVIFMSGGFGGSYLQWTSVRDPVNEFAQTVLYDRGGTGRSEPAPPPRDSKHIASELHNALRAARVKPPYVLVGHSLAGIHVRVYAHLYPAEVAGLVLIDPTSEDYPTELKKARPAAAAEIEREMTASRSGLPQGARLEYDSMPADYQLARESWPLPDVPVAVLTSMHPGTDLMRDSPMLWLGLHKDLVARIPGAKHIITDKVGHSIHLEQTDLVVDAIRDVVNRANHTN